MKKSVITLLVVTAILGLTACGGKKEETPMSEAPSTIVQEETVVSEATIESETENSEGQVFTGTVEEVKSFMVIATGEDGNAYSFEIENAAVAVGDKVQITYTGNLTDMDSTLVASKIEKAVK
ncbi:MAG: hypothetical protein RR238_03565 [Lachnospiraceae bacterium]